MRLLVACDAQQIAEYLATLARVAPLSGTDVSFVHVVDPGLAEGWERMAGHHWLRPAPGKREHQSLAEIGEQSAQAVLAEAMQLSDSWPTQSRQPVVLHGNPERELVRLALQEEADLLALYAHRHELGPHSLGRCARFVVDHAPCPVLLVRPDDVRRDGARLLGDRLRQGGSRPPPHLH